MQPYDGTGYGASMYWRHEMKNLADQNKEKCPCWSSKEPLLKFNGDCGLEIKIECRDNTCGKTFDKTEKDLTDKFKAFYKV